MTNTAYIDATTIVEFLKQLKQKYPDKPIAIVLDNARYQHCFFVTTWAKSLGIHLLFLPPYSPNLNIIERVWKFTKKEILNAQYYDSPALFHQAINKFTVIADAAIISSDNIEALKENKINYIVGARLGNLPNELISQIDKTIAREDGKSIRIKTDNGYLVCSYSSIRYRKDKYEMEKQIEKAKYIIGNPSKNKKLKFTKSSGQTIELNQKLIDKTQKILDIKGYCTNLEASVVDNKTIIGRYHELYKIEQAFRISKSDLQTRPIFHYKEEPIKLHLLFCFMALVVSKHMELQTNISIRKFIHECKKITDSQLKNKLTSRKFTIRVSLNRAITEILEKLNLLT